VRRRGLGDRVRFFGPIPNDELLYYTASADVGLCVIRGQSLSYRWSMPNKLFEYMMAGIPVVASDFEEMGRVVREEGVGTVCNPDDPQSIAAAVRAIIDDPAADARFRRPPGWPSPATTGTRGTEAARPLPAAGAGGGVIRPDRRGGDRAQGEVLLGALVIIAMWVAVLIIGVTADGEFLAEASAARYASRWSGGWPCSR